MTSDPHGPAVEATASRPRRRRALSRRGFLRAAGAASIGAAGLALVGCGGDDEPDGSVAEARAEPGPDTQEEQAPRVADPVSEPADAEPAVDGDAAAPAEPAPIIRRQLDPDRACAGCTVADPALDPLPGARASFGIHEGAAYRMEVPANWAGTLVLWAHGFSGLNADGTDFNPELTFGPLPFRELLGAAGIAWAASTYRSNGYVPALGVDDLLKTKDLFAAEFGAPATTVCVGASMGGATAQLMAQEFPEEIDGAVALCGALSNVEVVDYLASFHALALHFIGEPPARLDAAGLRAWGARLGGPDGTGGLDLTGPGITFVSILRELTGGARFGFEAGLAEQWESNFELGAIVWPAVMASGQSLEPGSVILHDGSTVAFDTRDLVYEAGPEALIDVDALNEAVVRFAPPPARRQDPAFGPATGVLKVPLLTIKGTGDLFTPISLDQSYARLVRAQGDEANLVQRAVRRAGHCDFSASESLTTLLDMTNWLNTGRRPPGEDLTGDLERAGLAFTSPFEPNDPLAPAT